MGTEKDHCNTHSTNMNLLKNTACDLSSKIQKPSENFTSFHSLRAVSLMSATSAQKSNRPAP